MICYKDKTFCTFYEDCANAENCSRPLTPEVLEKGLLWSQTFGQSDLIARFTDKPECHIAFNKEDGLIPIV